jgi:hypothetical protein
MEAVATGDEIASDLTSLVILAKVDRGFSALQLLQPDHLSLEVHLAAGIQLGLDQVFDDFLLAVDRDSAALRQLEHIDAMPPAVEAQLDSVMDQAFALQPIAQASFDQQIHRALFQYAGSHPLFTVRPAPALDDDRLDALPAEQMR